MSTIGQLVGKVSAELRTRETGEIVGKDADGKNVYKHPQITQRITFDFTGCTDEQIRELLTSTSPAVRAQSFLREQGTEWMQANPSYTFNVAEDMSGKRVAASPAAAMQKAAAKMSKDELAAQIKALEAALKAK